jgi:predicted DNA-binding transcriptional regulator YafY
VPIRDFGRHAIIGDIRINFCKRVTGLKIDRLLAMTMMLLNRKRVSAKELADYFEVSTKTIYRDIDTLNQAGIPIVAHQGINGGFEVLEHYTMSRQFLSLDELLSIRAAVIGISRTFDDQSFANLLEKVQALLNRTEQAKLEHSGHPVTFDFNPWGQGLLAKEKITCLRTAVEERRMVTFHYTNLQGTASTRVVEPAGLVLKGNTWYLQAYCTDKKEFRVFRVTRMKELQCKDQRFEWRKAPSLESYTWSTEWTQNTDIEVVLRFRSEASSRVEESFPSDQIEELPDGSIRVRGNYSDNEWLRGLLLSFGDKVKVEEPVFMAKMLKDMARKIVEQYAEL